MSNYNFSFSGGEQNLYVFETHSGAGYEVKFKPSGYLLSDDEFRELVFEMVISLAINPFAPTLPPADKLVAPTIAQIVTHFLNSHKRVVIYVCDDSDSRADARRKLFDYWFHKFSKKQYQKIMIHLGEDEQGQSYSVELVARVDNLLTYRIVDSFLRAISTTK